MDDFVFKVPELPKDNRRKVNNFLLEKNDNQNIDHRREWRNNVASFGMSTFDRSNNLGHRYELRPIGEDINDDFVQPSTSRNYQPLERNSNVGFFRNSFNRFANDRMKEGYLNERHNNCVNSTVEDKHSNSVFNSISLPQISNSLLSGRIKGNSVNSLSGNYQNPMMKSMNISQMSNSAFSARINGNCGDVNSSFRNYSSSMMSSIMRNPFLEKSDMYGGRDSANCFQQSLNRRGSSFNQPSHSLGMVKLIPDFPRKCGPQRNFNVNAPRKNFIDGSDFMSSTSAIQKDSNFFMNSTENMNENQSHLKSFLQMSFDSIKEEIMNKVENLGHLILVNAPEMQGSYMQTAKEIKNIFEKKLFFATDFCTTGMSMLNYSSRMIGLPQQSMLMGDKNEAQGDGLKKPSAILQNLTNRNAPSKHEMITSFTNKIVKNKNEDDDDFSFEEPVMKNFKNKKSVKEMTLKKWYPVLQKNRLAFVGLNDENITVETEAVKLRISPRKMLLENGTICTLIGSPSKEKKFPSEITSKIKNGTNSKWKSLIGLLSKFEKSEKKENSEIMAGDVSTTTQLEDSLNSTIRSTRSKAKMGKIFFLNGRNTSPKEKEKKLCKSPKDEKNKGKSKEMKNDSREKKNAEEKASIKVSESAGRKRARNPVEKLPVKMQKMDLTNCNVEGSDKNNRDDRIVSTTRSGRVVRRPQYVMNGIIKDGQNKIEKSSGSSGSKEPEKTKKEITKENQSSKNAKVKNPKEKQKMNKTAMIADVSPVTRRMRGAAKKDNTMPVPGDKTIAVDHNNSWGNDIDGLDDICLPDISIRREEIKTGTKKLKLLTTETPPLKIIRSNLTFLKNVTPVQSPDWQVSQHTRSEVKKFEKLRAQAFKTRIPKENVTKKNQKGKNPVRSNKDVDAVVNWIGEREVRSPKKSSELVNYIMQRRNEGQDEEDGSEDELKEEDEGDS